MENSENQITCQFDKKYQQLPEATELYDNSGQLQIIQKSENLKSLETVRERSNAPLQVNNQMNFQVLEKDLKNGSIKSEEILENDPMIIEQNRSMKEQKVLNSMFLKENFSESEVKNKKSKCQNIFCNSNNPQKKIKSKIRDKYLYFCKRCYERYKSDAYCTYCQQLYINEADQNNKNWFQCESCQRWNHNECHKQNYLIKQSQKSEICLCQNCDKEIKLKSSFIDIQELQEYQPNKKKRNPEIKSVGIPIKKIKLFNEKIQSYYYLHSFLIGYSYKLALTEDQIKKDLLKIRENSENQYMRKSKKDVNINLNRKKGR